METLKRYFYNIQETRSVLASSAEEADKIMYGEIDGDIRYHDSDTMFVFVEEN